MTGFHSARRLSLIGLGVGEIVDRSLLPGAIKGLGLSVKYGGQDGSVNLVLIEKAGLFIDRIKSTDGTARRGQITLLQEIGIERSGPVTKDRKGHQNAKQRSGS